MKPLSSPAPTRRVRSPERWAVLLGLLTAVGPFAIDMYLPALPSLAASLATSPRGAQLSVMAFFATLGAGQLLAGPLTDRWGRRRPLLGGLILFTLAGIGCALSPTLEVLVAMRILQGLGACACMVTPRAIVRDLYSGAEAARLMSVLLTIYSVSPIVAPLLGSELAERAGWRGVFSALALLGGVAFVLIAVGLPETRSVQARRDMRGRDAWHGYAILLADREFLALALLVSLSVSSFFVFVANSSFVYTGHFGTSASRFAVLFSVNAIVLVIVSRFTGRIGERFGLRRSVLAASCAQAVIFCTLMALFAAGVDSLAVLVVGLAMGYGMNGVIVPFAFVLAMERHGARAGSASALLGSFNFAGGALVVAMVSPMTDGTALPMLAGIGGCAAAAAAIAIGALKSKP